MFGVEFAQVLQRVFEDKFPPTNQSICYGSKVFPQTTPSSSKQAPKVSVTSKHKPSSKSTRWNNLKKQLGDQ